MNRINQAGTWLLALALPFSAAWCVADTGPVGSPLSTPAMHVTPTQKTVLIDLARAGERLVAVGERGLVLLSDDHGQSWRQAAVPVSVSLSAVQFVDAHSGWAIGHAGVVLATRDGGESWVVQLDGRRAAQIELDAARAEPTLGNLEAATLAEQHVGGGHAAVGECDPVRVGCVPAELVVGLLRGEAGRAARDHDRGELRLAAFALTGLSAAAAGMCRPRTRLRWWRATSSATTSRCVTGRCARPR